MNKLVYKIVDCHVYINDTFIMKFKDDQEAKNFVKNLEEIEEINNKIEVEKRNLLHLKIFYLVVLILLLLLGR